MNPKVGAEFDRSGEKGTWLGQLRQGQHLRDVGLGKFPEHLTLVSGDRRLTNHLINLPAVK